MSASARTFPVLWQSLRSDDKATLSSLGVPRCVPWGFVEPHEKQAWTNHGQTLARLAQRGGLSPAELLAIATGRGLREMWGVTDVEAASRLMELLREYDKEAQGG